MTLASRTSDNLYRPHFSSFYISNSTTSNYMGSKAREPFRMQLFCIMLHASSLCASFVVRIHLLQHDRHYTWRALPYTVRHPVFHLSLVISLRLVANNSSPHLPYQSPPWKPPFRPAARSTSSLGPWGMHGGGLEPTGRELSHFWASQPKAAREKARRKMKAASWKSKSRNSEVVQRRKTGHSTCVSNWANNSNKIVRASEAKSASSVGRKAFYMFFSKVTDR